MPLLYFFTSKCLFCNSFLLNNFFLLLYFRVQVWVQVFIKAKSHKSKSWPDSPALKCLFFYFFTLTCYSFLCFSFRVLLPYSTVSIHYFFIAECLLFTSLLQHVFLFIISYTSQCLFFVSLLQSTIYFYFLTPRRLFLTSFTPKCLLFLPSYPIVPPSYFLGSRMPFIFSSLLHIASSLLPLLKAVDVKGREKAVNSLPPPTHFFPDLFPDLLL